MTTTRLLKLAKKQKQSLPCTRKQIDGLSVNGKWAIAYALIGLKVFRLVPGTKVPFKGSHGFYDATSDLEVIFEWWSNEPDANIGIVSGHSSRIVVLDVDPRNGGDESLEKLTQLHSGLPKTATAITSENILSSVA